MVAEDALTPTADKALADGRGRARVLGCIPAAGRWPSPGWEPRRRLVARASRRTAAGRAGRRRRPAAADVHLGTESRPKGVMLTSRSLIGQYVSCIVDGGMSGDDVEVHSLPMYHCAQLDCFFGPRRLPRRDERDPARPRPRGAARDDRATSGSRSCSRRRRCGSRCCAHPDFDDTDLSSLRKGYYGASPMPVEVLREIQRRLPGRPRCGTSTGRPRWRRWPRSCRPTSR